MMTASEICDKLYTAYGQPRWWSDDPYIVMVQSVLVQSTSWLSVEKVTDTMSELLTPEYVLGIKTEELEDLIRHVVFAEVNHS